MKPAHFFDSFLDGFTGAGLFGRLRRSGAPTEFVDSRSVEEFQKSGEPASAVRRFHAAMTDYDSKHAPVTGASVVRGGAQTMDYDVARAMLGHR
jgi:hypothetical protein